MFYFIEPETLSSPEKIPKRRKPNMFIMYRKDMMKYKPHNMPMTKYSKLVSAWWKNIPAEEKARLQRRYQIDRDQKLQEYARNKIETKVPLKNDPVNESNDELTAKNKSAPVNES
ncbi:8333_t:CDS:1 [Funneliformis caledonium]|uniref:8333_t:CDS:1 n=1 Tax=Funneliformis caledonium TaxID=1117310 RepID=A0A9N9NAF7_9GLOM|nr:8333_t:CDS:1 [Funneliformis caledonium]